MQKMDPLVSRRITWIRSIFCILVVYVHCRNTRWFDVNTAPGIAALENRLCDIFAIIAVPAFFFISGYLFFRNYQPDQLLRKWKSRLFTLVIPFILWNLIYYLAEILVRVLPFTAGAFSGTEIPVTFQGILEAVFNYKYLPSFWFMQYLIIYTLLAPVIYFLLKKRIAGFMTILLVIAATVGFTMQQPAGWALFPLLLLQYIPAYLTGCYASLHMKKMFEERPIPVWKGMIFGLLSAALILWQLLKPSFFSLEAIRLFIGAFLWLFLGMISFPKPARFMQYTFFLYAAHLMIAKIINMGIAIKVNNHMITGGITWLLLPAVIVGICTLTGILFERFLPHAAFLLGIGGKPGKSSQNAVK